MLYGTPTQPRPDSPHHGEFLPVRRLGGDRDQHIQLLPSVLWVGDSRPIGMLTVAEFVQ